MNVLLSGLSARENFIFGAVLTVLVGILVVLLLIAAKRRRAAAPAAAPPAAAGAVRPVAPAVPTRDERTMDEHFARSHGQWVCTYCETLNDETLSTCRACGQRRG